MELHITFKQVWELYNRFYTTYITFAFLTLTYHF